MAKRRYQMTKWCVHKTFFRRRRKKTARQLIYENATKQTRSTFRFWCFFCAFSFQGSDVMRTRKRHKPLLSIEGEKWRKRMRINNGEWVIYDFQCFYSLLSLKSLIYFSFRENKCQAHSKLFASSFSLLWKPFHSSKAPSKMRKYLEALSSC